MHCCSALLKEIVRVQYIGVLNAIVWKESDIHFIEAIHFACGTSFADGIGRHHVNSLGILIQVVNHAFQMERFPFVVAVQKGNVLAPRTVEAFVGGPKTAPADAYFSSSEFSSLRTSTWLRRYACHLYFDRQQSGVPNPETID